MGRLRTILAIALSLAFGAAAIAYVVSNWSQFASLRLVAPSALIFVAVFFLASVALRGLFGRYVILSFAPNLTIRESLQLAAATTMLNFIFPLQAGAGLRALYMKRVHGVPYGTLASIMVVLDILFVATSAVIGFVSLIWIGALHDPSSWSIAVFLIATALGSYVLLRYSPSSHQRSLMRFAFVRSFALGWTTISESKLLFRYASLTVLGFSVFAAAGVYVAFSSLGLRLDAPGALLIASAQTIGGLASLTPGAFGFQELLSLYFGTVVDISIPEILAALALVRATKVITALVVGFPCAVALKRNVARLGAEIPAEHTIHDA